MAHQDDLELALRLQSQEYDAFNHPDDEISFYPDDIFQDEEKRRRSQSEVDFQLALKITRKELEEEANLEAAKKLGGSDLKANQIINIPSDDLNMKGSVNDPSLETKDPTPCLWHLFRCFDQRFFNGELTRYGCEVSWSPRMTSCAGLCCWNGRSGSVSIRISKPLLELRPRKDFVETLLHEMIHALLFVKRIDDNHESHGQQFHHHMRRINSSGGCHITVYHNFHDEVRHFKTHHWRCNGPCRDQRPFFGWVKRSMNRAPGPNDIWWKKHQETCSGVFTKVSEPEKTESKAKPTAKPKISAKVKVEPLGGSKKPDIRKFLSPKSNNKELKPDVASIVSKKEPSSVATHTATGFIPFSETVTFWGFFRLQIAGFHNS